MLFIRKKIKLKKEVGFFRIHKKSKTDIYLLIENLLKNMLKRKQLWCGVKFQRVKIFNY